MLPLPQVFEYSVATAAPVATPVVTYTSTGVSAVGSATGGFTISGLQTGKRYAVKVYACTALEAGEPVTHDGVNSCAASEYSLPAGVGKPSAPQSVGIQHGLTTMKVVWTRPTTDTASSYTVRIYKDAGADSYVLGGSAVTPVKTFNGVTWTTSTAETSATITPTLSVSGNAYTYELPSGHGVADGE